MVIEDLDFAYCEPCDDQKLCARVFCEPQGTCNGRFNKGVDEWVKGVTIEVLDPDTGDLITTGKTNKNGKVCFDDLEPGLYLIRVDEDSAPLDGWTASTEVAYERELVACEKLTVKFGFCKDCPRTYCCKGDLHEVIVESRHWVGDCPDGLDVNVWFYRGCDWSVLLDQIEVETTHPLPEKVSGVGEILTLEDIQVKDGIATIRVRVTAAGPRFPVGRFGSAKHRLVIAVNGDWVQGCEIFRAEKMRPGLLFPWDCECKQQRDCCTCLEKGETPTCDWSEPAQIDWDAWDRSDCNTWGMFGVLDVYCYRDWRECNPCDCEEECGRCKGGVTELTLRLTAAEDAKVQITSNHGVLFDRHVGAGEAFSISGNGPEGQMGEAIWLFINGEHCGDIPTDCCKPIKVGMRFGWLWVEGGESLEGGALCRWDNKWGDPDCKCKPDCDPCDCKKCGKRACKKSGKCECDCESKCDSCDCDKCGKRKCDCDKSRCEDCGNSKKDCEKYRCKSCGKCAQVCDSSRCDDCGDCSQACKCDKDEWSEKSSREGKKGKKGKKRRR